VNPADRRRRAAVTKAIAAAYFEHSSSIDHGLNACAVARDLSSRCCLGGRCVADDFVKNGVIVTAFAAAPRSGHVDTTLTGDRAIPG